MRRKAQRGKSNVLNRLLDEERSIVTPIPGATLDEIDAELQYDDYRIRSVIIALNKWDAVAKNQDATADFTKVVREKMKYLHFSPLVFYLGAQGTTAS